VPAPKSGSPRSARERRLSARVGAPILVPLALVAAAGLGFWLARDRLWALGQATVGGESQVREALANQVRAHLEDVYGFRSGGTLELHPVRYAEPTVIVEAGRATVVAMLEAEGRAAWRDQAARITYLGRERFHMRPCAIALWCAEGDQFARLRAALATLFRRHDALAAGDAGAYAHLVAASYRDGAVDRARHLERVAREISGPRAGRQVVGWQLRAEGEAVEVGEDFEEPQQGGSRRLRSRFTLRQEAGRWLVAAGF